MITHATNPHSFPYTTLFRSIEEIALLDSLRPVRREDADLERQPDDDRRCSRAEHPKRPVEVTRVRQEHDERGERDRSEEHTSELQSRLHRVCRLLLEKKK